MSDINELFKSIKDAMPASLRDNAWYIVAVSQTPVPPVSDNRS